MPPETGENAPLLGSNGHNGNHNTHITTELAPDELPPATRHITPRRRLLTIAAIFGLSISLAIGGLLVDMSQYDILEGIICDRIHGPGPHVGSPDDGGESPCKDGDVQGELATLMGWLSSITAIPGLFLAVPYGAVADRYGRRVVIGLATLGITLMEAWYAIVCTWPDVLPLNLVLLGAVFTCLGGGPLVFNSMLYTIVADVSTEAQRSTTFFYVGSVLSGGTLIARAITYLALQNGAWFATYLGISILGVTTLLAFAVPETLDKKAAIETDPVPETNGTTSENESSLKMLLHKASTATSKAMHTVRWLLIEQTLVGFLLTSLTCEILGRLVVLVTPQYISKRYHMPYANVNLLLTIDTITSLVLLMGILPLLSHFVTTTLHLSPREKDLRLAQLSAALAAAGTLIMALAETIAPLIVGTITMHLGIGYTYLVRGLMTSLVGGHNVGLLYSSIAFFETIVNLIAGPLYGGLFRVGVRWGGGWIGLPYLVAGGILVTAAVLIGVIRGGLIGGKTDDQEREEGGGGNRMG